MQIFHNIYRFVNKPNKSYSESIIEFMFVIIPIAFLIRTYGYGLYQVPTGSMETTLLVGERFFADKFTVLFRKIERGDIISFNNPEFNYTIPRSPNIVKRSFEKLKSLWEKFVYGPDNWTKRVIAIPGDEIKGVVENGRPTVYLKKVGTPDFVKMDEPYLNRFPIIAVFQPLNKTDSFSYRAYDSAYSLADQPYYKMTENEISEGAEMANKFMQPVAEYPNTPKAIGHNFYGMKKRYIDNFGPIKLGENEYWVMGDNRLGSHDSRMFGVLNSKHIHGKIVYRIFSIDTYSSWWIVDLILHPIKFWQQVRWERCMQGLKVFKNN